MENTLLPFGKRMNAFLKTGLLISILLGVSLTGATPAHAAPGDLDDTFGTDGKVITAIGSVEDTAYSVAIQPDGKIVAAGYSDNGSNYDFAVVRYNSDGSLNSSFGTSGIVTTDIGGNSDSGRSAAVQPDGKIVVAGDASKEHVIYPVPGVPVSQWISEFAVVRYNSDGSLDPSFGTGGIATTAIGSDGDRGMSSAVQPDGKIVVAGYSNNGSNDDFALVRYNSDGSLDPSFGSGGIVTTPVGGEHDVINSVAIQPDGKIVAAGYSENGSNKDFALVRYTGDGALDASFGTGGIVTTAVGVEDDEGRSVVLQADGKIVATGSVEIGGKCAIVTVRYTSDGVLDTSFGADGIVITAITNFIDIGLSAAIQSDGKIVVSVHSYDGYMDCNIVVIRYNSDGSLDTTFGTDGMVLTKVDIFSAGYSIAIQSDGKIVVAGISFNTSGQYSFAAVRYHGALPPTVTTADVSSITTTSAVCGGEVTNDGGGEVTAKGVCWSTSHDPSLADDHTDDGSGRGAFTGDMTGLTQGTTYFVRAYAVNIAGTAYGEEVSFHTATADGYYALIAQNDGSGSGAVTSSPAGIDCGEDCREVYAGGTAVTLTGTPDGGSALEGWTIDGEVAGMGNGPCIIRLDRETTVTATFNADTDSDGVNDQMENSGPNNGDGNLDGFRDSTQKGVTTLKNIAGEYITLVSKGILREVHSRTVPPSSDMPAGVSFPGGMVGFTLTGLFPGAATTVDLILHNKDEGLHSHYKYGPTAENTSDHWYVFHYDGSTGAVINQEDNRTVITLHLWDGARGDSDLDPANGVIVDPSGPASSSEEGSGNGGGGGGGGGCFIGCVLPGMHGRPMD